MFFINVPLFPFHWSPSLLSPHQFPSAFPLTPTKTDCSDKAELKNDYYEFENTGLQQMV